MKIRLLLLMMLFSVTGWGQTNPVAQTLPYSFTSLTGTTLPAGMAAHRFGTSVGAIPLTRTTIVANGDLLNGTNGTSGWGAETANGISLLASTSQSAGAIVVAINTTSNTNITVQWLSGTILQQASRDNSIALQYRVGTSGIWTDVGTTTTYSSQGKTAGDISSTLSEILPVAAENQALVQLRWVYWESNGAAGSRDRLNIDNISVTGTTSTNTITTSAAITGSPYCVSGSTGASVSVPFTSVGTFTSNTYTAQLSNAAGSFASPVNIGTLVSDLNSATITATIPAGTAAGTGYRIRVISNGPAVTGSDNTVNLTVENSAAITTQPSTTVQNICQGAAATALSVTATGTTLTYQWSSNATATNSGGTPVGTSSASYTPVTIATGTLYYYCVVSAACGSAVTSNVSGAVNVTAIPAAPAGTINVSANPSCGAATLSYSAPSASIYWQTTVGGTSTANPTTSNYISSATAGSYTIYVRELSGSCWSPATSVTFTVVEPVAITAQPPLNRTITDGSNTTFTVSATGTGLSFQWQVDTGSGFNNISLVAPYSAATTGGATKTNTLTITAATLAMNGYLYRCVVSGAAPCGSVISNSGSLTVSLTAPNNPTAIVPCYRNTSIDLSWTASSGGSAPDGYMVFALAGGTAPAATAAVAGNANLYTANSDFSLATVVTASLGKCLYIGTGTSFTVTGLTNLSNYSFKVVAYRGTTGTAWSSGITALPTGSWGTPTTNITIDMPEVTALAASIASSQSALTWTRPTPLACYDQYLVVANQGAVVFTPSGDGTAYTANSVYSGANQVVYKGTGPATTVTGLTNGTNYCYKVFVRRGTEWSDGVSVCQTPNIVYCASGATSSLDSEIENVTLVGYSTTISNNTANVCTTGVNNYTAMSADLQAGGSYTVSVEFGDCNGATQYNGAGGVWIDWNNDGDFLDANETIGTALVAVSTGNVIQNFTINVPGGQPLGNYRMRIVQTETATLGTLNPCGTFTYGSTEEYTVQVISACVPIHAVTSFTPTSGPVGTQVTINGTGLAGATVTFSGTNATIVSNNGTELVVVIPAGAITGLLSVKDSQPCAIDNSYTIVTNNNTSCEGAAATTDLIIYDIHDEQTGSGGFITLYNGTAATVDLTNYTLWRTTNHDDGAEIDYATLTGTIAPGALGILKVSVGSCGPASTNGTIDAGFNDNDGIQLRNAAGTVVVDDVDTYPTAPGYYMVRNTGALSARVSYVPTDWSTIALGPGVCYPSAGLTLPGGGAAPPVVTTHPTYAPSCGSTSAVLNTAGTEGFAGGNTLAYQWYFVAPGSATWTEVTDGGIYSGATTASLAISNTTTVVNYQYYCQIRENSATCNSASNAIKITDGSASTWNGTTWIGGTPTLTKAAIIDGAYTTATNGNFSCCSLTVNATRTLTISAGGYVEVQNNVTNNGVLEVLSDGSLIQISDSGVNTGNIIMRRTANIRLQDYVYWSSPVSGFAVTSISPGTPTSLLWKWNPTVVNTNGGEGNWQSASGAMTVGGGYIVRAPDGFTNSSATAFTANFTGVPNNGILTSGISRGSDLGAGTNGPNGVLRTATDDNWNLVGNPYPSAIKALDFLNANLNLDGFVNLWTHGTLPGSALNPFYGSYAYNYTANDYITFNGTGTTSGPSGFNGYIAAGQGFFVMMDDGAADVTQTITFNNSMRSKGYDNAQFYRSSASTLVGGTEKHRIWLDLISSTNAVSRILVGYVAGATLGRDRLYDAVTKVDNNQNFYSLLTSQAFKIQGRPVPFDTNDQVPLGVKLPASGSYTIALGATDGLFLGVAYPIFLEDKLLNIIHDLKQAPYSFTAVAGKFDNRFVLRYTNVNLGNDDFVITENHVAVATGNQEIVVKSQIEPIKNIAVYDVLGRLVFEKNNVSTTEFTIRNMVPNQQALIVRITLENGQTINRKIVF